MIKPGESCRRFGDNTTMAMRNNLTQQSVITSTPDILGGTLVFTGTRVPVQTLWDYLEGGDSLDQFLEDFPTVTREQTIQVLQAAQELICREHARS